MEKAYTSRLLIFLAPIYPSSMARASPLLEIDPHTSDRETIINAALLKLWPNFGINQARSIVVPLLATVKITCNPRKICSPVFTRCPISRFALTES